MCNKAPHEHTDDCYYKAAKEGKLVHEIKTHTGGYRIYDVCDLCGSRANNCYAKLR